VSRGVSNKASIHSTDFSSIVFIVTGIPFCCSELLISFACDLWVNPCWKILRLGNSVGDFLGVSFWTRDFLGVSFWTRDFLGSLEALGIFLGFDFLPPFDHPRHVKSGVPPLGLVRNATYKENGETLYMIQIR